MPPAPGPLAGFTTGNLRFEHLLGSGAMGDVYRGVQVGLERPVAIKVLAASLLGDREALARFAREAQVLSRLGHANVVGCHDFGTRRGPRGEEMFVLVLEYVDGGDLADLIGRISVRRTLDLVRQAALGLEAAHGLGLVHRDLKPENILVARDGVAKLGDFGLARPLATSTVTATGFVVGTPAYLAPETYIRSEYSPRADIYGLGCTLFHALTGTTPFQAVAMIDMLEKHVNAPVPTLASRVPALADLDPLMARCLAKEPADRFASAGELAAALAEAHTRVAKGMPAGGVKPDRMVNPSPLASVPDQAPVAAAPWRRTLLLVGVIVASLVLIGVVITLLRQGASAPAVAPAPPADVNALRGHAMAQLDAVARAIDSGDTARARSLLSEIVVPAGLPVVSARREALATRLRALTPE